MNLVINKLFFTLVILLGLTACPKKKSSVGPIIPNSSNFSFVGDFCIENATGRPVPRTNCVTNSTNSPINEYFAWINGQCYDDFADTVTNDSYCATNPFSWNVERACFDSFANVIVNDAYCDNGSVSGTYRWSNGQCRETVSLLSVDPYLCDENRRGAYRCDEGTFIAINQLGATQRINCSGTLCSGLWLYEYDTGELVYCD